MEYLVAFLEVAVMYLGLAPYFGLMYVLPYLKLEWLLDYLGSNAIHGLGYLVAAGFTGDLCRRKFPFSDVHISFLLWYNQRL